MTAIDINAAAGRMVCQMLAAVAEFERTLIQERTAVALYSRRAEASKADDPPL